MFSAGLLVGKRPFQNGAMSGKTALFRAHCQQVPKAHYSSAEHRRPHCNKMNVFHHLAMQSEALDILLQETHCTDAEKLVLPNYQLAGSSLTHYIPLSSFEDSLKNYKYLFNDCILHNFSSINHLLTL